MISIVTITYNNFEELVETLTSIKDLKDIESIVINGGTCERTKAYLSKHQGTVLNEKDSGIADAFNKGLRLARGLGVMFLNSGDKLIAPEYLALSEKKLNEYDFIHSDIVFDDAIAGPLRMKPALCSLGRGMPYFHQSMIVKKTLMDQVGEFNLSYRIAMDFDYVVRMSKLNPKGFYYSDKPTILMDGLGISATQEAKSLAESFQSLKSHGLLQPKNRLGFMKRQIHYRTRSLLITLGLKPAVQMIKRLKHRSR